MIYEVRTYDLQPRSLPEVIKRFGAGYEERKTLSELAGFFYSEIGPLNQIVHIWPYEDLAERDRQLEAQEQRRRQQQQQHTEEAVAARRAAEADEAAGAAAKEGRKLECTVCMENERNVMLMPCRHVATCAACASQLKGCCPICRRPVESTHQVYL